MYIFNEPLKLVRVKLVLDSSKISFPVGMKCENKSFRNSRYKYYFIRLFESKYFQGNGTTHPRNKARLMIENLLVYRIIIILVNWHIYKIALK